MTKQWQCTVCGYIHTGAEPPEVCPVCGADRSKFVPYRAPVGHGLRTMAAMFRLHPVAAHFPNGLMPVAALFLLLAFVLGRPGLDVAAYWLVLVVTAVAPVSLGSGLHDWRKHFGGRRAPIFLKKIVLALSLLTLGLLATTLGYGQAAPMAADGWRTWLFIGCVLGMLGCVTLLGHYGAILVFHGEDVRRSAGRPASGAAAETWAQAIVAQAPDAILVADAGGIIRQWNHGAERIFGVAADQALGQSLDLIIPEGLRQRHWEGWGKVMRTGESRYGAEMLRVPALRGDGRRFSAEFSIIMLKDSGGKIEGVAAILRDVSEQWEREKLLKEQLAACRQEPPR